VRVAVGYRNLQAVHIVDQGDVSRIRRHPYRMGQGLVHVDVHKNCCSSFSPSIIIFSNGVCGRPTARERTGVPAHGESGKDLKFVSLPGVANLAKGYGEFDRLR